MNIVQSHRRTRFIEGRADHVPDCFISTTEGDAPTLIAIHGISRNAAEIATRFSNHMAFAKINVVAPLFERKRFGKYQLLTARRKTETNSQNALFSLMEDLWASNILNRNLPFLFGFSGGAQMAHRMAMLFPERLSGACVTSAGWYLLPDEHVPYPLGIGAGCPRSDLGNKYLQLPITVMVGSKDKKVDKTVSSDPMIVKAQGPNRFRRAKTFVRKMTEMAVKAGQTPNTKLVILDGGTHHFGQCTEVTPMLQIVADSLLARKDQMTVSSQCES